MCAIFKILVTEKTLRFYYVGGSFYREFCLFTGEPVCFDENGGCYGKI